MKILISVGGVFILGGIKFCAKNADSLVRVSDNLAINSMEILGKAAPGASRIMAKQYMLEDGVQNVDNYDEIDETYLRNYFLRQLGQAHNSLQKLKSHDTTLSIRVERNYNWLLTFESKKYRDKNKSIFDDIIEFSKDTANKDIQAGSSYFMRLVRVKYVYLNDSIDRKDIFKDNSGLNEIIQIFKTKLNGIEKDPLTEIKLKQLLQRYCCTYYYPFHKELANKIYNEEIITTIHSKNKRGKKN